MVVGGQYLQKDFFGGFRDSLMLKNLFREGIFDVNLLFRWSSNS
jgi:hypothetical protein